MQSLTRTVPTWIADGVAETTFFHTVFDVKILEELGRFICFQPYNVKYNIQQHRKWIHPAEIGEISPVRRGTQHLSKVNKLLGVNFLTAIILKQIEIVSCKRRGFDPNPHSKLFIKVDGL